MHPPQFRPTHKLSDWPHCIVELHCCGGSVDYPVQLLIKRRGDMAFKDLVRRLRCKRCGRSNPAPVYVVAGASSHSLLRAGCGLGGRARPTADNIANAYGVQPQEALGEQTSSPSVGSCFEEERDVQTRRAKAAAR